MSSPDARSYWNARRNRSWEKYPTSFTAPNTVMIQPSAMPTASGEISGMAIKRMPSAQNRMEMAT